MIGPEKGMHRAGVAARVSMWVALVSFVAFLIALAVMLIGGR